MITVRYPNGQAIQYNEAKDIRVELNGLIAIIDSKGYWMAKVLPSSGATFECYSPCRVYNALTEADEPKLNALAKEIRSLKRKIDGGRGKREIQK